MYASSWFLTLFTTSMPLSLARRVMDLFISEVSVLPMKSVRCVLANWRIRLVSEKSAAQSKASEALINDSVCLGLLLGTEKSVRSLLCCVGSVSDTRRVSKALLVAFVSFYWLTSAFETLVNDSVYLILFWAREKSMLLCSTRFVLHPEQGTHFSWLISFSLTTAHPSVDSWPPTPN